MKPVVLLIPGMLNDARVWSDVAPMLAERCELRIADVLSPDTIAAMAEQAWAQVAGVPADVPLLLAGFSMGGYVAIEMLARPRRALQGAVLAATSARPETAETRAVRAQTIEAYRTDFPKTVERFLQWGTDQASPALLDALRPMMLDVGADTAVRQSQAVMARANHRDALAWLTLPVHVLCGTADRVTPPALSQELAVLIPGARLDLVPHSGHMLPREQPQAVANALLALLEPSPKRSIPPID